MPDTTKSKQRTALEVEWRLESCGSFTQGVELVHRNRSMAYKRRTRKSGNAKASDAEPRGLPSDNATCDITFVREKGT